MTSQDLNADRNSFPKVSAYTEESTIVTRFMELVPAQPYANEDLLRTPWYDPLDPRIQRLLKTITDDYPVTYVGEPITTVSAREYGNTSRAWIILLYNGFFHPDEIPKNSTLRIPRLDGAIARINAPKTSGVGRVVTV